MAESSEINHSTFSSPKQILWRILKWSLCAAVLVFVYQRGRELWNQEELQHLEFSPGWLVLSGLMYLVGWLPSIWFWQHLQRYFGQSIPYPVCARAYYCSHLGKYIPGKATVLLIRATLVKDAGGRMATGIITAACESLYVMGVGLAFGLALAPALLSIEQVRTFPPGIRWLFDPPWLLPTAVIIGCLGLMPVMSRLLTLVSRKMMPSEFKSEEQVEIPTRFLVLGFGAFLFTWTLMGLSLYCAVASLGTVTFSFYLWLLLSGSIALATSGGFLAIFAPGGVGVREMLLFETLRHQPFFTSQQVVMAAVLLRVVWFLAEILVSALVYWTVSPTPNSPPFATEDEVPA